MPHLDIQNQIITPLYIVMEFAEQETIAKVHCYHCGLPCEDKAITSGSNSFCCNGCKTVYEILNDNNLCEYYELDKTPGATLRHVREESYAFLDESQVAKKILAFASDSFSRVNFAVPAIHCISCIWLLENLQRLNGGVIKSEVNFSRKQVRIDFNPSKISLGAIARLLASLGYAPSISLEGQKTSSPISHALVTKLAIAGFCFGNIMLLSFPEYLGLDESDRYLKLVFSYLNLFLALPVILYSGSDYFLAAWRSYKQKQINIDVPIAVGLAALFLRSSYDILSHTGPGYLDSLSGLVFFLLIGRWFQSKTYDSLAFDRDYKSYFPLAINKKIKEGWRPVLVYDLQKGDTIRVRNMEIIPADSYLSGPEAYIDYSFVTGESKPVYATEGDFIYGGGRLIGKPVEFFVEKKISQSHLTSLWNNEVFHKKEESHYKKIIDRTAQKFTWAVMGLSVITAMYWWLVAPSQMWLVFTAVLMVACPCALALAAPFTFGNMVRVFGRNGFYLKNADVIERLAAIDAIVFDKTGTVTSGASDVKFTGYLTNEELGWIQALTNSSTHPLSQLVAKSISFESQEPINDFFEIPSKGIQAIVANHLIKLGAASFAGFEGEQSSKSKVYVSIDGMVRGHFNIETSIRSGVQALINKLSGKIPMFLLSGDHGSEEERMQVIFPSDTKLHFNQTPLDKLQFVSNLQQNGFRVMMVGDGLNDSGALKQSDVGVAVTDDAGVFTPASDGILKGEELQHLSQFMKLSKSAVTILKIAFGISFFYNTIALGFAVSGHLSPLIAAVLMPISSVSVVGFSTLAVNMVARNYFKPKN
jgi:Cu+-exporting ATPase